MTQDDPYEGKGWESVWDFMELRHSKDGPFWRKGDSFDYRSCWAGLTHPASSLEVVKMCADALIEESAWHEHDAVNMFVGGCGTLEERRAALVEARRADMAQADEAESATTH